MKRIISLLLALVMCVGILAGISFAAVKDYQKPDECAPEAANFIVTHDGDATAKYYFADLSGAMINWACQKLSGTITMTMTKDFLLEKTNGQVRFYINDIKAEWYNSKPSSDKLVLDLGGHTLSYTGDQQIFRMTRAGMIVKNGTIEHDSIRPFFSFGNSTENTATSAGTTLYKPVLTLENVQIVQKNTGAASSVIVNNIHGTTVNVKNSVLWAAKKPAIEISKTDQSNLDGWKPYTGAAKITVNAEKSTIGSGGNYPITLTSKVDLATDSVKLNIKDSILVAKKGSKVIADAAAETLITNGVEATVQEDWSKMLRTGNVTGTAYVYGDAEAKLPFTDVDKSAWYYTFVRDLYNAGIISGMTATTFAPDGTLTYGQALKLITLAVGASEQAAVDTHWASGYLNYAMGKGWLYNEVNLDAKITREQFCQIAAAAAGIVEQPAVNPFKDTADGAVLALYNAGIINGMTADTFSPNASLTRAQISKIICGILAK